MKLLHTMLRVVDLEKSITFYEKALGMRLLRRKDYESGRFTLAFLGYCEEHEGSVLELTHNWDRKEYVLGEAYGHLAFGVDDLEKAYQHCLECGATAKVAPKVFGSGTRLAFVKDPDGYDVELIELASKFGPGTAPRD
jgi:lactoylglutathione lyase